MPHQRLERFLSITGDGQRGTTLAAAHAAGFGSYAQFYRVFRDATGGSPSTARSRAVRARRRFAGNAPTLK